MADIFYKDNPFLTAVEQGALGNNGTHPIQASATQASNTFQLGEFLVEIGEGAATLEDPEILICGDDGQAIELLTPALLAEAADDPGADQARAHAFVEIYDAARRMALGVDKVIDTLILTLV